jgi:hypothetical protein
LHRLETAGEVLDRARDEVVEARLPVRRGRAVVEDPGLRALARRERRKAMGGPKIPASNAAALLPEPSQTTASIRLSASRSARRRDATASTREKGDGVERRMPKRLRPRAPQSAASGRKSFASNVRTALRRSMA